MADASSSDTTSDYYNECLSDISSEKSQYYVTVGQKPDSTCLRNQKCFLQKLITREIRGNTAIHSYAREEKLLTSIPPWQRLPLAQVVPKYALEGGHIVMGLTQCGQFLLTYTCTWEVGGESLGSLHKYLLHWWAFTPNQVARKVAEVTLFGNYNIYRELNIVIAQWPMERNKLVIHGFCSSPSFSTQHQRVDRGYLTITTVPSSHNCRDCLKVAASYEEEELAANWDSCVRCNCLQHGLTVHTTYEVISPYPRFQAKICLNFSNHVVVNTGNFLHVLRVDLENMKNRKINDKEFTFGDVTALDVFEVDETKTVESCASPESSVATASPKCESVAECDYTDEMKKCDENSGNQSFCTCNTSRPSETLIESTITELKSKSAISVRDEILQDFCEDASQELNIGNDSITLVKHSSISPRSTPQRLPVDSKPPSWLPNLVPPSDILKTRNSESSQKYPLRQLRRSNSPEPGASSASIPLSSINCLNTLSIHPSPASSPQLMSPPITTSFRHLSSRRRGHLQSPPPNIQQPRTRATYKLIQEAEKAYEFTDDTQETTCEKLSSFRKRRLADKKYEFCDEAEDAENIVPFKHIRDQPKHIGCTVHQMNSPVVSPVFARRHRLDSDNSESEDFNGTQDSSDGMCMDSAEKCVLRPLNQNQLSNGTVLRDRGCKYTPNSSPLVPKATLNYPIIKCTAHFKRSYIELDDEMISVITEVEDEETGGYVSYQCVLPMVVHGSGYTQMQMISNSKAEKMILPYVSISQLSFDIETFSHHIGDWICKKFKKKYWHCSDYDIEIIQICALSGDIICILMLKIQASEIGGQGQCSQERKQYEGGCEFTWNIETSEYSITKVLPLVELKSKTPSNLKDTSLKESVQISWNPTRLRVALLRDEIKQPYAHAVRYLETEMTVSADSIVCLFDLDNLVEFHMTPEDD